MSTRETSPAAPQLNQVAQSHGISQQELLKVEYAVREQGSDVKMATNRSVQPPWLGDWEGRKSPPSALCTFSWGIHFASPVFSLTPKTCAGKCLVWVQF